MCAPVNIYHLNQNLGNALSGDEYSNTLYSFNMLDDMESPQVVCKKEYSQDYLFVATPETNTKEKNSMDKLNLVGYSNSETLSMFSGLSYRR